MYENQASFLFYTIFKVKGNLVVDITQANKTRSTTHSVNAIEYAFKIRPQLSPENASMRPVNLGERLILHAMSNTSKDSFDESMSAGLNLQSIRLIRIYALQYPKADPNDLPPSIIEAFDQYKKYLGTFVGGVFVSPCMEKNFSSNHWE